ncbi:hypothetical protein GUJ93_ZPchr0006g45253 [Zizania palustris]|uniref:Uncharacterized protein n=1 Tax=Zizania palustris TaxID=103762 RepID=A0A8J5SD72_ZIZPA|nr:hypothetical protein GUJ93_ZPchr0006g45253 [Zizania palustris]
MDSTQHRGDSPSAAAPSPWFSLQPSRLPLEDILFCVDVDLETHSEMKIAAPSAPAPTAAASSAGAGATAPRPFRPLVKRMDAVKQALLLFVHSKLTMCPDHRFAFASLGDTVSLGNDLVYGLGQSRH